MIIPPHYTPIQIIIPDDKECYTILNIWDNIYRTNIDDVPYVWKDTYSTNIHTNIDDISYISHIYLARTYNLIYTLIKTDKLNKIKFPYTVIPASSAENIELYKLDDNKLILEDNKNISGFVYYSGKEEWFKDRLRHRDNDLPAVILHNGRQEWWKNGFKHRDNDLPALINSNGSQEWYKNGKLHRDNDLPAVIKSNGSQEWYKDGLRHRDNDLPSVIKITGTKLWYKNGKKYANPS